MNMAKPKPVDLICCHETDGKIIPIKVRTKDEDGQYQAYVIKEYKDLSHGGCRIMPDGVFVSDNTLIFECAIVVFGREKTVRLYNNPPNLNWIMTS
jgi:hypothetical protein